MSFEWVRGRLLDSVTVNETEIEMKYDSNGMRTQKGNIHYYYDSNNNLIALVNSFRTLFFYYDESGSPTSFSYNGIMHYYVKNLQGDIVKIVNGHGETVASYEYDAWGKILSIKNHYGNVTDPNQIALVNPFRYRGYVYDDETGLYYLQSRYYDPVTCRFLNADIYCDTRTGSPLSTNMYAYCENNPIMKIDKSGEEPASAASLAIIIAGVVVLSVVTLSIAIYSFVNSSYFKQFWEVFATSFKTRLTLLAELTKLQMILRASQAKSVAQSIANSFARVKTIPKYKKTTEVHHIVAQGAKKAKEAQSILLSCGIQYKTDARNLIRIKTGLHRRLHTNNYYSIVNNLVIRAYNGGKNKTEKKNRVVKVLQNLKDIIGKANNVSPF